MGARGAFHGLPRYEGRVRFTAGFPALSAVHCLTHGIPGIGRSVTISVVADPDVVALPAEVTFAGAPAVLGDGERALAAGARLVDLAACVHFDSSLIGVLLELARKAQAAHVADVQRFFFDPLSAADLEALVSPVAQRFARGLHRDCMGMTGNRVCPMPANKAVRKMLMELMSATTAGGA